MALTSTFSVHFQTGTGQSFGQTMNDIRSWLDHQRIEPTLFKPVIGADAGFEIAFNSEEEAQRFRRVFA